MPVNLTFALPAAQSTPTVLTSSWRWIHLTWTTSPALHWWVINISEWSFESIYPSLCASAWSVHFFWLSSDVGLCSGPHRSSTGALPMGPQSSGYSWFAGSLTAQHCPIQGPHATGWAFGAAATDPSSSEPAVWQLDGQMEGRITDQWDKQQPDLEPP